MSSGYEPVEVSRDCPAVTVPAGRPVMIPLGHRVRVTQRLGSSATVQTERGILLRVDVADFDAIGLEATDEETSAPTFDGEFHLDLVTDALKQVYDPEIPVNVVDLGLVYRCEEVIQPNGVRLIDIDMTMTAPGCGMGDVLAADAEQMVMAVPGVDEVRVNLVWDPPWGMDRMSDETKLELGLL